MAKFHRTSAVLLAGVVLFLTGGGLAFALGGSPTVASGVAEQVRVPAASVTPEALSAQGGAGTRALASTPADPDARGTASSEEVFRLHARLFASDLLILSTWLGERGAIQSNPADGVPIRSTLDQFPEVLAPLRDVLRDAPEATAIKISGVRLPTIQPKTIEVVMEQEFGRRGVLGTDPATNETEIDVPGTYQLGGLPIRVFTKEGERHYEINVTERLLLPVSGTQGLFFVAESTPDDKIRIQLVAPSGEFTSEGCQPMPGTRIPPGHYVWTGLNGSAHSFLVYKNHAEYALKDQRVDVEITILDPKELENVNP